MASAKRRDTNSATSVRGNKSITLARYSNFRRDLTSELLVKPKPNERLVWLSYRTSCSCEIGRNGFSDQSANWKSCYSRITFAFYPPADVKWNIQAIHGGLPSVMQIRLAVVVDVFQAGAYNPTWNDTLAIPYKGAISIANCHRYWPLQNKISLTSHSI